MFSKVHGCAQEVRVAVDRKVPWLDAVRSLAIILVLLSHGRTFLRSDWPWVEVFRFGGFMGVELFFVLSGFLIGGIVIRHVRQGGEWLKEFYIRRWFRTLPNYYLFIVLNISFAYFALRPAEMSGVWKYVLLAQNLASPHPDFFPEAWSLAVEEVFYLLFPLLLFALIRIFQVDPDRAIVYVCIIVIMVSLAARSMASLSIGTWDQGVRKIVFFRLDSIMTGVLLAWWINKERGVPGAVVAFGVALFVLCASYIAVTPNALLDSSFFAKTIFFSLASFGCAAVVVCNLRWTPSGFVRNIIGYVANISYAAYFVNLPVVALLVALNLHLFHVSSWLAFFVFTLFLSHVVYRYFERPVTRLRDQYTSSVGGGVHAF